MTGPRSCTCMFHEEKNMLTLHRRLGFVGVCNVGVGVLRRVAMMILDECQCHSLPVASLYYGAL